MIGKGEDAINRCPKCNWKSDEEKNWNCQACGIEFEMFGNVGICPACSFRHSEVICVSFKGGCDQISPLEDWYTGIDKALHKLNIFRHGPG